MTKRFSASSAAQLMACPGSADLEAAIPGFVPPVRDDTKGAKGIGTQVHVALEEFAHLSPYALDNRATIAIEYSRLHYLERRKIADDGAEATLWIGTLPLVTLQQPHMDLDRVEWLQSLRDFAPAMLRFIGYTAIYMGAVLETVDATRDVVMTEEMLIADWLPSKPGTTPDVTIVSEDRLEVVDYKSGKIPVDPVGNAQLLFYLACKRHLAPKATEITVHIVQPGNMVSWTAPIEYLDNWMNDAINADRRIIAKDLTLNPGDHCKFCEANPQSRGDKGHPFCPPMLNLLYPPIVDLDEILGG